jgi:hypothetical protein
MNISSTLAEYDGTMNYPKERGSLVGTSPTVSEGPTPFYPSMCIKSHWDATAILRKTLPTEHIAQALDPRPWARICMEYTTTGEDSPAPPVNPSAVLPNGGQFYPISRYMAAIDDESKLRRLDRPLEICETDQFQPNINGDMYDGRLLVPTRRRPTNAMVEEIAFPKVLMTAGPYDCRNDMDKQNMDLSHKLFFNATKQDKYKLKGKV